MSNLKHPSVVRVANALLAGGSDSQVFELVETGRSAHDAAASIGTELGSIVKSIVFTIGYQPVMALIAGDRQCDTKALPAALGLEGKVRRPGADVVRVATGFAIGGVAPLAHTNPMPVVIDASLGRFPTIFASAGHPYCVFTTTIDELAGLTKGVVSGAISHAS